jgi:hypothetical protein
MSGECDKCGEHCLECSCKRKSFEQLVQEKAGCFEFAWNGYIRMYEEGEKRCECKDCQAMDKLKADIDEIYTRVPIDMPFEPPVPKSHARRLHDAKVLENAQRLKNLQDMENGQH